MKNWLKTLFNRQPKVQERTAFEKMLYEVDPTLLERPEAKLALIEGALKAKRTALRMASVLAWTGWPLLFAVFGVSFVHIWHQVAQYKPANVPELPLPAWTFNAASGANTFLIDLLALFLVATAGISIYVGKKPKVGWAGFYLTLTGLLNGSFYIGNDQAGDGGVWASVLPYANDAILGMFVLLIPVSIFAVERAIANVNEVRLPLMAEVKVYERILEAEGITKHYTVFDRLFRRPNPLQKALEQVRADLRKAYESLQVEVEAHVDTRASLSEAQTELEQLRETFNTELADWEEQRRQLNARIAELERQAQATVTPSEPVDTFTWRPVIDMKPLLLDEPPLTNGSHESKQTRQKGATVMLCEVCGVGELDATEKGIAGRTVYKRKFGGKYACRDCRNKAA